MKSLYNFIVTPFEKRYDNIRKMNDNELIINTNIEDHSFVSKKAVVVSTPAAYKTKVKKAIKTKVAAKKQAGSCSCC